MWVNYAYFLVTLTLFNQRAYPGPAQVAVGEAPPLNEEAWSH